MDAAITQGQGLSPTKASYSGVSSAIPM
jgi:hypothetical protein